MSNKRRRQDDGPAGALPVKGLPGWKYETDPDDVLDATNRISLCSGSGPISKLKLQITFQRSLPQYFLLGVNVLQSNSNTTDQQPVPVQLHVVLDAHTQPGIVPWLTIKKAQKLLGAGAVVSVNGNIVQDVYGSAAAAPHPFTHSSTTPTPPKKNIVLLATHLTLTGAIPTTPYLARLLCLPLKSRQRLFSTPNSLLNLTSALRPCTVTNCVALLKICAHAVGIGKQGTLFKNHTLAKLRDDICCSQGWHRGPRKTPSTSARTWGSLLRLEARWCTASDGDDASCQSSAVAAAAAAAAAAQSVTKEDDQMTHHQPPTPHLIYGHHDVDPALNIPDANDTKRMQYINERKRPQVKWMVDCVQRLMLQYEAREEDSNAVPASGSPPGLSGTDIPVRIVDIGGGRGDLAMAIAAFFNNSNHCSRNIHVTVIDMNQNSLDAGRQRATAAGLSQVMSFELCDVTDTLQVQSLLAPTSRLGGPVALVVGLHCCGGLTEAAIELAITARCNFCVCSCCFCSNPSLNTLARRADATVGQQCGRSDRRSGGRSSGSGGSSGSGNTTTITTTTGSETPTPDPTAEMVHMVDRKIVAALASSTKLKEGQHRAMRAINAMRLAAARAAFLERKFTCRLDTHQETFPSHFSVQNRVLIGEVFSGIDLHES